MRILSFCRKNAIPLILLTPLRAMTIVIMPYFLVMLKKRFKGGNTAKSLLILLFISSIYGLFNGTDEWQNVLLSWFILSPIVYLFCSDFRNIRHDLFIRFVKYSTIIIGIIDFLVFFTYFIYGTEDDFGLPYGHHFNNVHGLSMLNAIMFFYYGAKYFHGIKDKKYIFLTCYFFICFIMCFYGTGLLILILTITLFLIIRVKLKQQLLIISLGIIGFGTIYYVNRNNLIYLETQIGHFTNNKDITKVPRKILFLQTVNERLHEETIGEILCGFGPGSYNGRIAFLLNKEAENPFVEAIGKTMPKYHKSDVFIYWNAEAYDNSLFRGGTANKPNSSFISIFMENGILFGLVFFGFWIRKIFRYAQHCKRSSIYIFLFLAHVFYFISAISEQWIETSEFLYYIIFCGFSEAYIKKQDNKFV